MPTTSVAGVLPITNLGPLTTTFTAPSTCATQPAISGAGDADVKPPRVHWPEGNCEKGRERADHYPDCLPSGDKWRELVEGSNNGRYSQPYYSPGLHCPRGYTTVGIAEVNDSTTSASGILDPTFTFHEYTITSWLYKVTGMPDVPLPVYQFTSALGPGETAIVCCPSGYTADAGVECYSTFPATELAGSTGCVTDWDATNEVQWIHQTWDYRGETMTGVYMEHVTAAMDTYTFDKRGGPWFMPAARETVTPYSGPTDGFHLPRYQGVALQRFFWIVHGEADLEGAGVAGPSETGSSETDENAAASVAANVWWVAGALAAIWGICSVASTGVLAC